MIDTVFGLDPGNVSGWAVLTVEADPRALDCGKVDLRGQFKSALEIISDNKTRVWARGMGVKAVAIEGQYLDKGPKQNVDGLIKLSRKAGRWEEAASTHGLTYEYIQPSVWITAELGHGLRRDQIAILAKQKCEALYGIEGLSEHEYCAILIGRYVAIREWRRSLQQSKERG